MLEILKAGATISEGSYPTLAKVWIFVMLCASVLIVKVMMGKI
jgi:hypothetical protein